MNEMQRLRDERETTRLVEAIAGLQGEIRRGFVGVISVLLLHPDCNYAAEVDKAVAKAEKLLQSLE